MQDKTVIVVAHRLSTIQKMDRIIVIDNGKIIEQGSHLELLANTGSLYKKLWELQAGGFLKSESEDEEPASAEGFDEAKDEVPAPGLKDDVKPEVPEGDKGEEREKKEEKAA